MADSKNPESQASWGPWVYFAAGALGAYVFACYRQNLAQAQLRAQARVQAQAQAQAQAQRRRPQELPGPALRAPEKPPVRRPRAPVYYQQPQQPAPPPPPQQVQPQAPQLVQPQAPQHDNLIPESQQDMDMTFDVFQGQETYESYPGDSPVELKGF